MTVTLLAFRGEHRWRLSRPRILTNRVTHAASQTLPSRRSSCRSSRHSVGLSPFVHLRSAFFHSSRLQRFAAIARLAAVHLVDAHLAADPAKYMAALLASLAAMLHLELPHVNVLSKVTCSFRLLSLIASPQCRRTRPIVPNTSGMPT